MNRNASNVLVGILFGAVAGGVTALLLAPASGSETRQKIKDTLRRGKEKVFDRAEEIKDLAEAHQDALMAAVTGGKDAYQKSLKKSAAETTS
jgi:gas vesicle protein